MIASTAVMPKMNPPKKVLVIAAHPDDEVLGIGGTLIKHREQGDDVYALILGEGVASRKEDPSLVTEKLSDLKVQAWNSGKIIGFKEMWFAELPDNEFDSISLLSVTKIVESYIDKVKPNTIYTHHKNDLNIDHQKTFQAVITACRPCNPNCPKEIITFETLSSTEWQPENGFNPNLYLDIEKEIETKLLALSEYKLEIRTYPHPRSLEGIKILAQYRGLQSGLKYAEALMIIRIIK